MQRREDGFRLTIVAFGPKGVRADELLALPYLRARDREGRGAESASHARAGARIC
jgi:hypothetical protein